MNFTFTELNKISVLRKRGKPGFSPITKTFEDSKNNLNEREKWHLKLSRYLFSLQSYIIIGQQNRTQEIFKVMPQSCELFRNF